MKDLAYFEANPDEFEALSDEDRMLLANGEPVDGEITGESPDAESTTEQKDENQEDGDQSAEQVVLAKDGKHTIPFDELQKAREAAAFWQAQAEEAKQAIQQRQESQVQHQQVDLKALRRQLREATLLDDEDQIDDIEGQIDAELVRIAQETAQQQFYAAMAAANEQAEQQAITITAESLIAKYPDLDHTKPTANTEAIAMVQALSAMYANDRPRVSALSDAVAKVASLFGMDNNPPDISDAAARAEKVISAAKAKQKVPSSMASIPSAPTPPSDEMQAIGQMSQQQMQDRMMEMPREKILALLARQM
ncbi:MAG: hypothetical protein KBE22_16265 [Candidatus Accumulibacter sp.]|nr:hypothetical protein [Accumulibacter sp.]